MHFSDIMKMLKIKTILSAFEIVQNLNAILT